MNTGDAYMLTYQRQLEIMEILKEKQVATVEYLSGKLYASGATIRRDLSAMEKLGLLKRIHGGATVFESTADDAPLLLRTKKEPDKKRLIAELAVHLAQKHDIIFMDSSSTVTALAALFDQYNGKTVVTNGLMTANVLNDKTTNNIYLTGGKIVGNSSLIGESGLKMASGINAGICFFSCCGFGAKGTTEAREETAVYKKTIAKNAKIKVLLCDSTKINTAYFWSAIPAGDIDYIVTDKKPPEDYLALPAEFIYPKVNG